MLWPMPFLNINRDLHVRADAIQWLDRDRETLMLGLSGQHKINWRMAAQKKLAELLVQMKSPKDTKRK